MSNISGFGGVAKGARQWPAALPQAAFAGVRTRRIMAAAVDITLIGVLVSAAAIVLALPTLGLSILLLLFFPVIFAIVAFFYNGFAVSGRNMGTVGMRLMDIEIGMTDGTRAGFVAAGVHAVLFYASWYFPPVFLVSLLSGDKRCLHDMLADVIVTRRTL